MYVNFYNATCSCALGWTLGWVGPSKVPTKYSGPLVCLYYFYRGADPEALFQQFPRHPVWGWHFPKHSFSTSLGGSFGTCLNVRPWPTICEFIVVSSFRKRYTYKLAKMIGNSPNTSNYFPSSQTHTLWATIPRPVKSGGFRPLWFPIAWTHVLYKRYSWRVNVDNFLCKTTCQGTWQIRYAYLLLRPLWRRYSDARSCSCYRALCWLHKEAPFDCPISWLEDGGWGANCIHTNIMLKWGPKDVSGIS